MKDPMKSRDKITQKMSRDGLTEQNQTTGESELISKRIQDADFQENAGAASRTGRGAASRGAFHVLSFAPCAGAFFKAAGRSRRARHGAYRRGDRTRESLEKKLSGERRKRQRQRRSRPVCNLPTRNGQRRSWKSTSRNRTKPPTVWTQRGRHFPQRRNRGCNLTSRKRRELRGQAQSLIPPRAGSRDFRP